MKVAVCICFLALVATATSSLLDLIPRPGRPPFSIPGLSQGSGQDSSSESSNDNSSSESSNDNSSSNNSNESGSSSDNGSSNSNPLNMAQQLLHTLEQWSKGQHAPQCRQGTTSKASSSTSTTPQPSTSSSTTAAPVSSSTAAGPSSSSTTSTQASTSSSTESPTNDASSTQATSTEASTSTASGSSTSNHVASSSPGSLRSTATPNSLAQVKALQRRDIMSDIGKTGQLLTKDGIENLLCALSKVDLSKVNLVPQIPALPQLPAFDLTGVSKGLQEARKSLVHALANGATDVHDAILHGIQNALRSAQPAVELAALGAKVVRSYFEVAVRTGIQVKLALLQEGLRVAGSIFHAITGIKEVRVAIDLQG